MALGFGEARRRTVARLSELLTRTSDEGAWLALVDGPRGAAKHALFDAFADDAGRAGARVLDVAVLPGSAFSPLAAVLEEALALVDDPSLAAQLACRGGCHDFFFQHAGAIGGSPERALGARRARLDTVHRLFGALGATAPTVLLVRNFDAASADVLDFIEHLIASDAVARPIPRLLVACDVAVAGALPSLGAHARTTRIAVGGLDEESLREVLTRPDVVAKIMDRTGGRPEAVERLLAAELPSPEQHLTERCLRLGAAARAAFEVLAVLAVLDEPAAVADVARIAGVAVTADVVNELLRDKLVARDRGGLRLVDPADGARGQRALGASRRRALHGRGADLMASRGRFGAAARHALAAGRPEAAVRWATEAAASLAARHAHREAAVLLEDVGAAVGPEPRRGLDPLLADALLASGQLDAAVAPARRAFAASPTDASAGLRLSRALVLAGHLEEAARVLSASADAAAAAGDAPAAWSLAEARAELCFQRGRLDEAEELCAALLGESGSRLDVHQTYAKVALARGHLRVAEERYRAYELAACAVGSPSHEALAVGGRGVVMITAGDLRSAERALSRCASLAEGARDHKARALADHNLAVVAHLNHDYAKARERYEVALRSLTLVGNRTSLARAAYNLGELYEGFGAYRRARALCDYGAQVGGAASTPRATAEGLLLRGRVALAEGALPEARSSLEAAREILMEIDPLRGAAATASLGRVLVREGRLDEADAVLAEAPPGLDAARRADLALLRAELAEARGDEPVLACEAARAAAEVADDERLRFDALLALGRVCLAAGRVPEARRALSAAAEVDGSLRLRVPDDLVEAWEDRPHRREMVRLSTALGGGVEAPAPASPGGHRHPEIIGPSAAMQRVRSIIDRVGPSDCNVLVRGESGTGKELVARALHRVSRRRAGPLVAVNCAAIVESLLLSDLFGHEKGAFTGAHGRQIGRFERARGGTLFLDEIGDVSPAVQAALLRVLSERSFERVGGRATITADVRLIAATNRDLEAMVREGTFREDLYYRLNELSVHLPPLRDRCGDVPMLAAHILATIGRERDEEPKELTEEAMVALTRCPWPGNVRQLENVLRAATILATGERVQLHDLDAHQVAGRCAGDRGGAGPGEPAGGPRAVDLELRYARLKDGGITLRDLKKEIERELVERALAESGGNISRAAGVLGMKRPRLSQLVKEYGLRASIRERGEGG